ncbi:MAG: PrsW family glutamic-type intramembrane protease [Anaerolineae bacterium]|nr:PrsW family glutamic-type intramembrane protease [Anaerolineae bacterium]
MSKEIVCCICDKPVGPPYHIMGKRAYCAKHYATVNYRNQSAWRAGLIELIGLALFGGAMLFLSSAVGEIGQTGRLVLGIILSVIPSALWLSYFYANDRYEPEPKNFVVLVFFTALALYELVGRRLIEEWFRVPEWASYSSEASLAAHMLIIGMVFQGIQYVAIRTIYTSQEFDERMDGIVYGTVAGLGLATILNLRYVIGNEGVAIGPGVVTTITNALAQASFGGLLGYVMAQAKFEHKPTLWVPLGFAVVAMLNGLFVWLMREVSIVGLNVVFFRTFVLGFALAAACFLLLQVMMRRATRKLMSE